MSGQRPSDWDDEDEVFPPEADQPEPEAGARLSDVSAFLATVSAPVMPDSVEARISAALAAQASARAADGPTADSHGRARESGQIGDGARSGGGSHAAAGPGTGPAHPVKPAVAHARARVRRRPRLPRRPGRVIGWPLLACLLFAGLGWVIVQHPAQSSSSSSAAAPVAAGPAQPGAGSSSSSAASGPGAGAAASAPAVSSPFTVTESGTSYRRATLPAQVRVALARQSATGALAPGADSSQAVNGGTGTSGGSPSAQLRGCVLHFTDGTAPKLVDRATYQGTPAYVIASASQVWVVGLGCTSTQPELIATVPLAG